MPSRFVYFSAAWLFATLALIAWSVQERAGWSASLALLALCMAPMAITWLIGSSRSSTSVAELLRLPDDPSHPRR
jgi:hypothetical protein